MLFDDERQELFAALSGDRNPIHMDPAVARRSRFGRPIVHGWHLALWALDRALAANPSLRHRSPVSISASLRRAVLVGERATASADVIDGEIVLTIATDGGPAATVTVGLGNSVAPARTVPDQPPRDLTVDSPEPVVGLAGTLPISLDQAMTIRLFPRLDEWIGADALASMISVSTVIGMRCPGEHSMLSSWRALLDIGQPAGRAVDFRVSRLDDRFGLVEISVSNPTMECTAVTFRRPSAVRQASVAQLRHVVTPTRFSGHRVLVVGGSRGVGEVATKLLAMGGADVLFTYHRGAGEAAVIADELADAGHPARTTQYDIADPASLRSTLEASTWWPTALCYFATPAVFVGGPLVDPGLMAWFRQFSVVGLAATFDACRSTDLHAVLFPSSVAVDAAPAGLAEYAAAKAEGEAWCDDLRRRLPHLRVLSPRLPRMLTDQTATIVPTEFETVENVLAPLLDQLLLRRPA